MIDLVIPDKCEGCGACCQIFDGIFVNPSDKIAKKFTTSCKPRITEYGEVATRKLKMVESYNGKKSTCSAWDKETGRCTTFGSCPRVCREFVRGCFSCRIALLMVNHAMDFSNAQMWPGHQDVEEPPGYQSKVETEQLGRRSFERRIICYHESVVDTPPDEPGPWICTHCFRYADKPEKVRHRVFCVGNLFGAPYWWWYLDPRKWGYIRRQRRGARLTMPGPR